VQQNATPRNIKFITPREAARNAIQAQQLTTQQIQAIERLLQGRTDIQVAAELGVDRSTIYRWRRSSFFAEVLGKLRAQAWEQSAQRMQSLIDPALDLLNETLKGDDRKLALRAAGMVLRTASSVHAKPSSKSRRLVEKPKRKRETWDELEAFINAPMPLPGMAETIMKQQNRT
jgi:DNA-binding CsgD family transcriptional regulator